MTLCNLSSYTVNFKSSRDFIRLTLLIYAIASTWVLVSGIHWLIKLATILLLITYKLVNTRKTNSSHRYQQLIYRSNQWLLIHDDNTIQKFDNHKILLELGLFFVLELTTEGDRKIIFVFFDQISSENYKALRILEKI